MEIKNKNYQRRIEVKKKRLILKKSNDSFNVCAIKNKIFKIENLCLS